MLSLDGRGDEPVEVARVQRRQRCRSCGLPLRRDR
jgi:hypothetical protein